MIVLRFLHDTPFDMFEGTYKLARDCYGDSNLLITFDTQSGHIILEIYHRGLTPEQVEADIAPYTHWFTAEESA